MKEIHRTTTYRTGNDTTLDHEDATTDATTFIERLIYFVAGVILALLAFRFILSLLGANRGNGFADFIYSSSHPLVQPFFGLFGYNPQFGVARFEFETLIAMLVYGIIALGLASLVSLGRRE
jgi:hypothetical protein